MKKYVTFFDLNKDCFVLTSIEIKGESFGIKRNKNKIQYNVIFINNGFGIEYKKINKNIIIKGE